MLEVDYDDGFIAYLNERVASANAPAEVKILVLFLGGHDAGIRSDLIVCHAGLLQAGKNVLAVVGLNIVQPFRSILSPKLALLPMVSTSTSPSRRVGARCFLWRLVE